MIVSYFKTVVKDEDINNPAHVEISKILKAIKNGKWKHLIEEIRSAGSKDKKDVLKKRLPAILFGGKFSARRIDGFMEPSNIVLADIDKMPEAELADLKDSLRKNEYVYAFWTSPSGNGIKVLFKSDFDTYEEYKEAFCNIDKLMGQLTYFDMANSDISRACFVSYDPDIYINEDSIKFPKQKIDWVKYTKRRRLATPEATFDLLMKWMDKNGYRYAEGGRNHYIYVLASALCRYGIEEGRAQGIAIYKFSDLDSTEISKVFASAYKQNEFGIVSMTETEPDEEKGFYKKIEVPDFEFDPSEVIEDNNELNKSLHDIASGNIKRSASLGLADLDKYLLLKENELYAWVAKSKAGKTLLITFLAMCAAKNSDWKFLILTTETEADEYKYSMAGFYLNKPTNRATPEEIDVAINFIDKHFVFIKNDLDQMQIFDVYHYMHANGKHFNAIILDPITNIKRSPKIKGTGNEYYESLYVEYLKFSKRHCSLWVVSHVVSQYERESGHPLVAHAEFGAQLARRCHYGITMHRDQQDEMRKNIVEMHVRYVRTSLTKGGEPTISDYPIKWVFNIAPDRFGYDVVVDMKEYRNPLIYRNQLLMAADTKIDVAENHQSVINDYSKSEPKPEPNTNFYTDVSSDDDMPF